MKGKLVCIIIVYRSTPPVDSFQSAIIFICCVCVYDGHKPGVSLGRC